MSRDLFSVFLGVIEQGRKKKMNVAVPSPKSLSIKSHFQVTLLKFLIKTLMN